jgi:hypothetical protein
VRFAHSICLHIFPYIPFLDLNHTYFFVNVFTNSSACIFLHKISTNMWIKECLILSELKVTLMLLAHENLLSSQR